MTQVTKFVLTYIVNLPYQVVICQDIVKKRKNKYSNWVTLCVKKKSFSL